MNTTNWDGGDSQLECMHCISIIIICLRTAHSGRDWEKMEEGGGEDTGGRGDGRGGGGDEWGRERQCKS